MRRALAVMAEARPSKLLVAKPLWVLGVNEDDIQRPLHVPAAKGQSGCQAVQGGTNDDHIRGLGRDGT